MTYGLNETINFEGAKQVGILIEGNYTYNTTTRSNILMGNDYNQTFNLKGGTQKQFVIDGDWLSYSLISNFSYTIEVFPVYDDNKVVIEPLRCRDGYTEYTYLGQVYRTDVIPAAGYHQYGKDGKCTVCGTGFDLSDYNKPIIYGEGYDETFSFPGAEGMVIALNGTYKEPIVYYGGGEEGHVVSTPVYDAQGGGTIIFLFLVVPADTARVFLPDGISHEEFSIGCIIPIYGDNQIEVAPSCKGKGGVGYTWLGYTYQTSYDIEPKGHHYTQKRKADDGIEPTCSEKGKITHYCDDCDYSYVEEKAPLGHTILKNGTCQNCGKPFSDIKKNEFSSGAAYYDKTIRFPGAESIEINFTAINCSASGNILIYDKDGNTAGVVKVDKSGLPQTIVYMNGQKVNTETGVKSKFDKNTGVYSCTIESGVITVTGDTAHIVSNLFVKGFTIKSITPNYPSDTASVLSDGNLWIILVVAVLALGGVGALAIVKKKKKPAVTSGASDSDEE